jgi:hypothetical protein
VLVQFDLLNEWMFMHWHLGGYNVMACMHFGISTYISLQLECSLLVAQGQQQVESFS